MTKNKIILGASLTGFSSLFGVANADVETVRTSEKSEKGEIIKSDNKLSEDEINLIKSLSNNLVSNNKNVNFTNETVTVTKDNVNEVKQKLVELQKVINLLKTYDKKYEVQIQQGVKYDSLIKSSNTESLNYNNIDINNLTKKLNEILRINFSEKGVNPFCFKEKIFDLNSRI